MVLLVCAEVKNFVLDNVAAGNGAPVIIDVGSGFAGAVEIVPRAEETIGGEFEQFAVEFVATAFGNDLELGIGVASEFGGELSGDEVDFLDGIERQGPQAGASRAGYADVCDSGIIESDIVAAAAAAVRVIAAQTEVRIIWRDWGHSRSGDRKLQNAACGDRQVGNILSPDGGLQLPVDCVD
jgi:hypothetical protein